MDCANGVGAVALKQLLEKLPPGKLRLRLCNTDTKSGGKLNADCGADFVQKERTCPRGWSSGEAGSRCNSMLLNVHDRLLR